MNLFKGLMFLEGHFTRPEDLEDTPATSLGNRSANERWLGRIPHAAPRRNQGPALGLLQHLQFLGGRPMHPGHNLDLDEPFEQFANQPAANEAAALRDCAACG